MSVSPSLQVERHLGALRTEFGFGLPCVLKFSEGHRAVGAQTCREWTDAWWVHLGRTVGNKSPRTGCGMAYC